MPPKDLPQPSPQEAGVPRENNRISQESENARPPLFVEAFGTQALRQLTP